MKLTNFKTESIIFKRGEGGLLWVDNGLRSFYCAMTPDGWNTDYPIKDGDKTSWDNPEYFSEEFKQAAHKCIHLPIKLQTYRQCTK